MTAGPAYGLPGPLVCASGLTTKQAAGVDGTNPFGVRQPHHEPKAKRVIFMFMQGGPSHLDTFDYKPELAKAEEHKIQKYMGSAFEFKPRGKSGIMISDAFPELSKHADDLCLLNGMQTAPATGIPMLAVYGAIFLGGILLAVVSVHKIVESLAGGEQPSADSP